MSEVLSNEQIDFLAEMRTLKWDPNGWTGKLLSIIADLESAHCLLETKYDSLGLSYDILESVNFELRNRLERLEAAEGDD